MNQPPRTVRCELIDHDAPLVHEWRSVEYTDLVAGQREYSYSGATRPVEWNDVDFDLMDVGICIKEAEYAPRHLRHWMFGPILPVLEIDSVQGVINSVNGNPHPLGLYIFAAYPWPGVGR